MSPFLGTLLTSEAYVEWSMLLGNEGVDSHALPGKTPRQAVRSKAGRDDVLELLRTYETNERRQSEAQDRDSVDLGFLWEELGLERS